MTDKEAASPRNTCPLCWQLTHVPLLQFMPSRGKEKGFRCSSCNERIQVARNTQLIAYMGGLATLGAMVGVGYLLALSLGSKGLLPRPGSPWALVFAFGIIPVSASFLLSAVPFARLALRLEPWVDEPI